MDQPPPVPVRQGRRRESGAHSGTTRHRTLSASAAQKKPVGEGESQLEEYCRHVEEDFVELRGAYQDQSTQLEAVETLMKESKLREEMLQAVDRRVKLTCNFLQEMVQLTTDGRGLRQREDNATNSSTKRKNQLGSLNYRSDDIMAMMDAVRDGFQKRMKELQTAREGERVNLEAAKAAEKEVQQLKRKVDSLLSSSRNRAPTSVEEDICIPASAEEVNNLRRQLNDASRQNRRTLEEVQKLTSDLKKSQQEVSVAAVRLNLQESELKELRARLESKDKLIAEAEKRYKAAEERLAQGDGPSTTNTHTRPVRGGRTQTHHYISLRGKEYAAVLKESPEEFKDSFVKSVSKLLRVSADAVTNVDLLYGGDGVSGEFDLQHNSTLEEIDYTLLRHAFPELDSLRRRGETLCKHWAVKSTASLVKELGEAHESLKFAQTNATTLNSRVRALEASLERRDVVDGEVESALLDTEKTIQDLYNALEEQNATVVSLRATVKEYEEKCNGMQSQLAEEKEMRKDSEAETDRKQALLASAELKLRAAEKEVEKLSKQLKEAQAAHQQEMTSLQSTLAEMKDNVEVLTTREAALKEAIKVEKDKRSALLLENTKKTTEAVSGEHLKLWSETKAELEGVVSRLSAVDDLLNAALPTQDKKKNAYPSTEEKAQRLIEILRTTDGVLRKEKEKSTGLEGKLVSLQEEKEQLTSDVSSQTAQRSTSADQLTKLQKELEVLRESSAEEIQSLQKALKLANGQLETAQRDLTQQQKSTKEEEKTTTTSEWEAELQRSLEAREAEVAQLTEQLERARRVEKRLVASKIELEAQLRKEQRTSGTASARGSKLAPSNPEDIPAATNLQEELHTARRENDTLTVQIKELEVDMNGLGKIQSELQTTLEETQKELRAKKNDMDVLVKQMIRMEENERALRLELESMKAEGTPAEECKTPNQKSSKALPLAPSPLLNQTEGKKTTTASRLMAPLNTDKTPPSRIMKRSNSASAFSRNNSTTGVSPVESFNDVKNADGHRVITSRGSGGSHGSNNNPFNRTNSSRSKYTQYQSSALDKNKNSADRAGAKLSDSVNLKSASGATPRRRVLSPTAGSRKPNTATGGASFVRTPSGYQRIDSAAATPEKATPIRN